MAAATHPGYSTVTELPGAGATAEQLAMLYTRYHLAAQLAAGGDALEVACGPGIGLGYLARRARRVIGGDVDSRLLGLARRQYRGRMPLVRLDAQHLPFAAGSFDVVILFEALYYLARPEAFVAEARRVLRPGGAVAISAANPQWPGFNPSPFAHRYLAAGELKALLAAAGFAAEVFAAFPVRAETLRDRLVAAARRTAVRAGVIPKTMAAKSLLKRLIYGRLQPLPAELQDGLAEPSNLVPVHGETAVTDFKVLFAVGRVL